MSQFVSFRRIAGSTTLDLVRRPAFVVGTAVLGVLLGLLPHLRNPAAGIHDNVALAVELTVTTLGLVGPLVAACVAAWAMQRENDAGMTLELLASPTPAFTTMAARWAGAVSVSTIALATAVAIGLVGWCFLAGPPGAVGLAAAAGVALSVLGAVGLGGSIGVLWGSVCTKELSFLLVVAHLVAGRALGASGGATDVNAVVLALLPDPARLDLAREVAFGRAIAWGGVGVATFAALCQTIALLAAAAWLFQRRLRIGAT